MLNRGTKRAGFPVRRGPAAAPVALARRGGVGLSSIDIPNTPAHDPAEPGRTPMDQVSTTTAVTIDANDIYANPPDPDTLELEPVHPGINDAAYVARRHELFALMPGWTGSSSS